MRSPLRSVLALLLVGTALSACDRLVDHGELDVAVSPTPATVGQTLNVTVANGTQRPASYNPCSDVKLTRLDRTDWTVVLPAPGTVCTAEVQTLAAGASFSTAFSLAGQRAGTYRVDFTPMMEGGQALARSDAFEVR